MKVMRNPEVKRSVLWCGLIVIPAVLVSFWWDEKFGLYMTVVCFLLLLVFWVSTRRRYQRIAELAAEIDLILHGKETVKLEQYTEGELAILQSEIYKMTVRLREQQHKLMEDKRYLADSLADISHQIRTPLTSIHLLVEFLAEPDVSTERRQQLSHELFGLLSQIDWLITALLKISKLDAGTVHFVSENIPIKNLIDKAVSPVLIPMELRNQTLAAEGEGEFHGDVLWTSEAITNIVKNCMEHTPEQGSISVTAKETPLYEEIIIQDTGCGIDSEDLPHVFERFYKGKNSSDKSFGIGLALARMIITAQNGTIKVENVLPHGTKFTIRFYKETI